MNFRPIPENDSPRHLVAWQACRNLAYPLTQAELSQLVADELNRNGATYRYMCLRAIFLENEETAKAETRD